jgi:hypothetical protein
VDRSPSGTLKAHGDHYTGGFIKAGNIGESADCDSSGSIEAANVGGNADLHTSGGSITTGVVNGKVKADSAGARSTPKARGTKWSLRK